jgi:hypothetical protein
MPEHVGAPLNGQKGWQSCVSRAASQRATVTFQTEIGYQERAPVYRQGRGGDYVQPERGVPSDRACSSVGCPRVAQVEAAQELAGSGLSD